MPLAPNQQLYEYRIVRRLGQGGFGTVYLAHDTLLDRPVAIKELSLTRQTDEQAFKRFLLEARTAGGLNHPNIVTVYALKVDGPTRYLVMEYVSGGSLRSPLERHGKLDIEQAVKIAIDVCEGLAAVHAKGIIHRDIKPENILLTEDSRAKVSDFGIAHVPRGAGGTNLTQAGFQPGTLVYMSPEQVLGKPVDARSDVYQVGELLYEMLAGKHYIDLVEIERQARDSTGGNSLKMQAKVFDLLADAVCVRPPKSLGLLRPDAPDELRGIIETVLCKKPSERPATASALAIELRGYSSGNIIPTQAVQPRARKETRKREKRKKKLAEHVPVVPQATGPEWWYQTLADEEGPKRGAEVQHELGAAYGEQGRLDDAIREYQEALRIDPNDAKAHLDLGLAYAEQDRLDDAICEYQEALRINPDNALVHGFVHHFLGSAYLRQGRLDDAVREHQEALRIDPDNAIVHHFLGSAYLRQGRLDDAVREYQEALRIDPNDAEAHYELGFAYKQQGRLDEAVREYQAEVRINPKHDMAHNNLGFLYAEMGQLADAVQECQTALRINPENAYAHDSLGYAYWKQGRIDDAIREYQVALRIAPNYGEAHFHLSVVYQQQNRLGDAITEAQMASQFGYESAREFLAKLTMSQSGKS